jgi:hypothetical protein
MYNPQPPALPERLIYGMFGRILDRIRAAGGDAMGIDLGHPLGEFGRAHFRSER